MLWALPPPPPPALVIRESPGGIVEDHAVAIDRLAAERRPVMIDGWCASACTLLLALPPGQLCVTPRSELLFHAARSVSTGRIDRALSRRMEALYPARVRAWLARRGGLTARDLTLKGRALARALPLCGRRAP